MVVHTQGNGRVSVWRMVRAHRGQGRPPHGLRACAQRAHTPGRRWARFLPWVAWAWSCMHEIVRGARPFLLWVITPTGRNSAGIGVTLDTQTCMHARPYSGMYVPSTWHEQAVTSDTATRTPTSCRPPPPWIPSLPPAGRRQADGHAGPRRRPGRPRGCAVGQRGGGLPGGRGAAHAVVAARPGPAAAVREWAGRRRCTGAPPAPLP